MLRKEEAGLNVRNALGEALGEISFGRECDSVAAEWY